MAAMTVAQRMTAEEFLARPERPGRGRESLVEGELIVHSPKRLHQQHAGELEFVLQAWTRAESGRGVVSRPLDVRLDELNVYEPDLLWYREGCVPGLHDDPPYPVPDLAVEVRSPSTWRYDVGAKKAAYERHSLPELWLVDTAASVVLVFRRSRDDARSFDVALELGRDETLTSPLLPGFGLDLAELFEEPG